MDPERESPLIRVSSGNRLLHAHLPSTRTRCGLGLRFSRARRMASNDAWRILMVSISSGEARPVAQQTAVSRIRRSSFSRCAGLRAFESFSRGRSTDSGRITAAATTGPARGPRPTSSTPAIRVSPPERSLRSNSNIFSSRACSTWLALSRLRVVLANCFTPARLSASRRFRNCSEGSPDRR